MLATSVVILALLAVLGWGLWQNYGGVTEPERGGAAERQDGGGGGGAPAEPEEAEVPPVEDVDEPEARERLEEAEGYWLLTVRPDGSSWTPSPGR